MAEGRKATVRDRLRLTIYDGERLPPFPYGAVLLGLLIGAAVVLWMT